METNETLGFQFHPKVTDVVSQGHYSVSLKLYQNSDFTDLITTYPYAVDIHGRLHVEFKVDSYETELQIMAENCRASPSLEDTEQTYNLIQHGCSRDSTLQTHPVSDHRLQRFSVHVFRFNDFQEVYLSCNVIICHNETSPNRCTQGCNMRRHRRDTHSSDRQLNSARLSQGPILFKSGQLQADHTVPSSVLVAVVGVMGFLSVLGLVIQKHHYRRHNYTLLGNGSHQQ
ncbi:CUB and zona pellucida-like domain-containing protein 1 [Pseudophryne corroboree]|uniref:CUB and zona pellucida-like domain-containing protein 1 n=1 Tax=Pseudophryne corroboree TaxID=495146 RepID=UPI00308216D3